MAFAKLMNTRLILARRADINGVREALLQDDCLLPLLDQSRPVMQLCFQRHSHRGRCVAKCALACTRACLTRSYSMTLAAFLALIRDKGVLDEHFTEREVRWRSYVWVAARD